MRSLRTNYCACALQMHSVPCLVAASTASHRTVAITMRCTSADLEIMMGESHATGGMNLLSHD